MKKLLVAIILLLSVAGTAGATLYSFSDSSSGGTASATQDINVVKSGNNYILTLLLNNTSPNP